MGKRLNIAVCCAGVLLTFWAWERRFGETLEQTAISPDGSTFAEVRLNTFAAATDADVVGVKLYSNSFHFGDFVFDASTYGGQIRVKWQDKTHLRILLSRPDQLAIYQQDKIWRGISISYETVQP